MTSEVSGQLHAPAALPPGEKAPGTHCIWGWVASRAGLEDVEKILDYRDPDSDPSVVQPIASNTDYAIPTPIIIVVVIIIIIIIIIIIYC
jgi:hypothetical protein